MYEYMNQRVRRSAFSLIELLSVIAIMSIVAGISVSSLVFSSSVNLTAEGNNISDTIAFARQNSISQDSFTAIVVQTNGAGSYTIYCLMQLKRDTSTGSFASSTWQQLTAWRHLENGVVFDPSASVPGSANFFGASGSLMGAPTNLSYQGVPMVLPNSGTLQVFRPDGTMTMNQTIRLRLVRGSWNSPQGTVSYQGTLNGSVPANYYDVLFLQNAGQTKIIRPE
jgi:prepilin-type N-terminal cleavage/methylation domain-containing protein